MAKLMLGPVLRMSSRLAQLRKVRQNGSCALGMAVTARCTVSSARYLETEVTDRQFLMLRRGRASTSIDQCASRTRQDDRRSRDLSVVH